MSMNRRNFLRYAGGIGFAGAATHETSLRFHAAGTRGHPAHTGKNDVTGYLEKRASREIAESPWGMDFITIGDDIGLPLLLERIGESGVKWARVRAGWSSVERSAKGNYDWRQMDEIVEGMTRHGIRMFMQTGGSNRLYHEYPRGYSYPPTRVPEALDGYCAYVRRLVERYGDRVTHYEIYNEPNIRNFWRPDPDAKEYGLLVQRAGEAVHSVKRDAKVIAGVLAGAGDAQTEYARQFMEYPGVLDHMDILCYHPYNPHPELSSERVAAMRKALHALKPGLPFMQGECGCPSSGDTIHFRGDAPWGYTVQSKWLLRRLLTDRLDGAMICTYFLNVEFRGTLAAGDPTTREGYNTKGLIQHTTWAPKPAFYTLQNLVAAIDGSCKPVQENVEIEITDPGIFYGIGPHEDRFPCVPWHAAMRRNGSPLCAYWLPWRPQEIIKPATVRITWPGVSWNEPVYLDFISGEIREAVRRGDALEVPLADYPLLLTELGNLDFAREPQQPGYEEITGKLRWTFPI